MTLDRRLFTKLLAAFGVSTAAPALAQSKTVEVTMRQQPKMIFVPQNLTVSVGDTVRWTNPFSIPHTVTFDPSMGASAGNVVLPAGVEPFDSGDIEESGTFMHTFTVAGEYKYICKYHESLGMVATLTVK